MFSFDEVKAYGVGTMYEIQRKLSFGQAIPVVGPLIVSPVKFGVSAVQTGVGLPVAAISAAASVIFCCNNSMMDFAGANLIHAALGGVGMAYSSANILTAGILAFKIEEFDRQCCQGYTKL